MNGKWIQQHWFGLAVGLVLLLAIFVRFAGLGRVPSGLYWDEVAMLVDARSLAQTGKDMHGLRPSLILPSYGDYKLPVYTWLSAPLTLLPISPEVQIRLVSTLAGIGTVLLAGLLAAELFLTKDATQRRLTFLCVAFVAAILPWSIHFSHTGFEGHLGQFLVALSVYCMLLARRRPWLLVVAGLVGTLSLYTYYSVRFVWPLIAVTTWLFVWKSYAMLTRKWLVFGLIMLAIFGVSYLAMINSQWYAASQQFRLSSPSLLSPEPFVLQQNEARKAAGNSLLDRLVFHRSLFQIKALLANFSSHLSPVYLFVNGDDNLRHGTAAHGLGYLTMLPLLLAGTYVAVKKNKWALLLLLIWWFAALIPASVPLEAPHALRSLNALVPFAVLLGFGLSWVFTTFTTKRKYIPYLVCIVLLIHLWQFVGFYPTVYPNRSASSWQTGYKSVAHTVHDQLKGVDRAWVSIDDRWYLWYLVYGNQDPLFAQSLKTHDFKPSTLGEVIVLNAWPVATEFQPEKTYILAASTEKVDSTLENLDAEIIFNDSNNGYRVVKFIYATK